MGAGGVQYGTGDAHSSGAGAMSADIVARQLLDREGKRERTKLKCGDKSLRIPSFPAFTNIIRDITCPCD